MKISVPQPPAPKPSGFDLLVRSTEQKLELLRDQIFRLKGSSFPYPHGAEALTALQAIVEKQLAILSSATITGDEQIICNGCSNANIAVARILELLGYVLRSTNVRNSFEYYDGLLRLSRALVGPNAKLILTSEWEFSPFTRTIGKSELAEFVFIGLPASETGNALILPLAGHEIGHSMWQHHGLEKKLKPVITQTLERMYVANIAEIEKTFGIKAGPDPLQNLFVAAFLGESMNLLMYQCQEIFCDIVGLGLFGEGYLYAFLYLLAPNLGGPSSHYYPTLGTRAAYLKAIAQDLGCDIPENFTESFFESERRKTIPFDDFAVGMADKSAEKLIDALKDEALKLIYEAKVALPTAADRDGIAKRLRAGIPAQTTKCIADIVNAGWSRRLELEDDRDKIENLNDLILKSIEVLEYVTKTKGEQ